MFVQKVRSYYRPGSSKLLLKHEQPKKQWLQNFFTTERTEENQHKQSMKKLITTKNFCRIQGRLKRSKSHIPSLSSSSYNNNQFNIYEVSMIAHWAKHIASITKEKNKRQVHEGVRKGAYLAQRDRWSKFSTKTSHCMIWELPDSEETQYMINSVSREVLGHLLIKPEGQLIQNYTTV